MESTTRAPRRLSPDCVHHAVACVAGRDPGAEALRGDDGTSVDYGGLWRRITDMAAVLRTHGIAADDRVAVLLPEGMEGAAALLSVAAGAVCAPLQPAENRAGFDSQLELLRPAVLMVPRGSNSLAVASAGARRVPVMGLPAGPAPDGEGDAGAGPARTAGPGDTALLLQTSGTTAAPKLVPVTHGMLAASAANISEVLALSRDDRLLSVMPLHHVHGASTVCAALWAGGSVCCPGPFSADRFADWLSAFGPTWYTAAPAIHAAVVACLRGREKPIPVSSLRFARSASAPMPASLAEELESLLGVPLIESYGMTEAAAQIASNRLPPHQRKPGSVGRAAGPEVAIADESGRLVPAGEEGEILIRGVNVITAYADGDPADRFPPGWFRTGDAGYLDEEGFLFITGRMKEIINRGGEKISPMKVEQVLMAHPAVARAVCFPVAHPTLGEDVAAAVVVNDGAAAAVNASDRAGFEKSLRAFAAERLARHQVPREISVVAELPADAAGKIDRRALSRAVPPERPAGRQPGARAGANEPTPAQAKLLEIIRDVLGDRAIGAHDDFFMSGGDSLSAAQVAARIEQAFGIDAVAGDLFDHATVAELHDMLARRMLERALREPAGGGRPGRIVRRRGAGPRPVSYAQQRIWILDRLGSGSAYNVSATLHLSGPLDPAALARSLDAVRRRHDTLRAVFRMEDGRVVQDSTDAVPAPLPSVDLSDAPGSMESAMEKARRELDRTFDLAHGPVYRATLIRLAPEEHLLVYVMHHIISDGWSRNVLHRELAAAYAAETGGPPLPVLAIQYGDYAAWQRQRVESGVLNVQLQYWRDRLEGAPMVNGFPADRPRPAAQTHRGASHVHGIDRAVLAGIESLAKDRGATLFMVLLAAFKTLYFRYTSQPDCVLGTPVAGRTAEETEALIGCFANTLVLRTDLSGDPPFIELLARVRQTTREAWANQELPFDKLVEALQPERDLGRMPLFQVMFALQDMPNGAAGDALDFGGGLAARPVAVESAGAKFDVTVYLSRSERGLDITWQYSRDLFEPGTIARLGRHYALLLAAVAADPTRPIGEYPLPPEPEAAPDAAPVREWVPETGGFAAVFEARARETPGAAAVDAADGMLTYAALDRKADRLARRLRGLGIGPGSIVALVLPRLSTQVTSLLAVWKAGGAALLCDPSYPGARTAFMLADAGAGWAITPGGVLPAEADTGRLVAVDPEADGTGISRETADRREPASDDPAYIVYTSGSSGEPKGVVIDHGGVVGYAAAMRQALGVAPGDRYLHTASFGFSSSIRQVVVPLGCGASMLIADEETLRDPLALFGLAQRRRATIVDLVPSYLRTCVRRLEALDPQVREALLDNHLRLSLSASEPLSADLARQWRDLAGGRLRLINMYGQTETTGIVATHPVDDDPAPGSVVPAGRPIPGVHVQVLDDARRPVPDGVVGEIYVGGPGVARGYVNRPGLTAARFNEDPARARGRLYRTGDLGRRLAGGVIELAGRADEQIKLRGYRIEPGEIESALCRHPGISEAALVLAPCREGEAGGDGRLVAFVVLSGGGTDGPPPSGLREFLAQRLPVYMLPAVIVVLDALPRLAGGKLDRRTLRALGAGDGVASKIHGGAPETPTERRLAAIWQRTLGVEQVGPQDNFFDLGGDSLLSIQVVQAACDAGLAITLGDLFRNQSLAALARAAEDAQEREVEPDAAGLVARPAGADDAGSDVWLNVDTLGVWSREALAAAGLDVEGARIVSEVQLEASLRGQSTHNLVSIPRYARRIAAGLINPDPDIRVEHVTPLSATVDGDNGPGQWVSVVAIESAIRKALEHGIGVVSARRSNHFGAAGHYAWLAARRGLIGICTTNGPVVLAPTGGLTPNFGNNPLAVGIPAGDHFPVLLDATMSVAPRGKIGLALSEGRGLSPGWILDRLGRPSTDLADLAAGLGVPIGGHKGYGLALVMETLAGVLSGAGFGLDHRRELLRQNAEPPDTGHFFLVIDPAVLMEPGEFTARVDRMIDEVKGGERAPGTDEILIPGEAELRSRVRHLEQGAVALRRSTYLALDKYGREAGLETRLDPAERIA